MIDNVEEFQIHEMKKSKSRRRDQLSELPQPLIFHILWLLPMRDVVRTTILSKHWRNLWTTAPCLNFDLDLDYDHVDDDMNRFRNFVNRALILWEGVKIQKFKIDLHSSSVDDSFCGDFDFWLCFALRKKVQELYVRIPYEADESVSMPLPQNLYSCSSLEVLSLVHCRLEINGNVQWNQLQSLRIDAAYITEHAINQVLCGSPQLEVFSLTLLEFYENYLSIRSSSLKRLSINYGDSDWDPSGSNPELRIWTPNLETFKISSGVPYATCYLKDVSSLTHLNLGFCKDFEAIDLLEETLKQVLPTIQHVEKVTLSDCCIKVLGDMINRGLIPSSSNAKFLKLNNHWAKYEQIVGVLQIFPKLEMLVLEGYHYGPPVPESLKFDANLPESFLLHLRTIDITAGDRDNYVFSFMKIVLENASKLEKMVFRLPRPSHRSNDLFLTSQKLLRMQRSFPAVELMIFSNFL